MGFEITNITEAIKTAMPWITGGVGGALVTFSLNRYITKRNTPRLITKINFVDYDLPSHEGPFEKILVSYKGRTVKKLYYWEFLVENTSRKTADQSIFTFSFPKGTTLIERYTIKKPVNANIELAKEQHDSNKLTVNFGQLRQGDSAKMSLILSGGKPEEWYYRGPDSTEVVVNEQKSMKSYEELLHNIIGLLAIYLILGIVPEFADLLRGLMLLLVSPLLIKSISKFYFERNEGNSIPTGTSRGPSLRAGP